MRNRIEGFATNWPLSSEVCFPFLCVLPSSSRRLSCYAELLNGLFAFHKFCAAKWRRCGDDNNHEDEQEEVLITDGNYLLSPERVDAINLHCP